MSSIARGGDGFMSHYAGVVQIKLGELGVILRAVPVRHWRIFHSHSRLHSGIICVVIRVFHWINRSRTVSGPGRGPGTRRSMVNNSATQLINKGPNMPPLPPGEEASRPSVSDCLCSVICARCLRTSAILDKNLGVFSIRSLTSDEDEL